ncbi:hypothetical protein HCG51_33640 [Tolypothrix sp. PCC 7910]|nr:hypothetical protein [Tolypothrix sp. PCC 7910]QIR41139.1 hypothetical protein HCG51_33640 [Tolypothrix sp. PCC 7910]
MKILSASCGVGHLTCPKHMQPQGHLAKLRSRNRRRYCFFRRCDRH